MGLSAQKKEKNEDVSSLDSIQKLDEIVLSTSMIFGNKYVAKHRTGSAYYLSPKELQKFIVEKTIIKTIFIKDKLINLILK